MLTKNGREITLKNLDGGWTMQDGALVLTQHQVSEMVTILTTGIFDDEREYKDG
jgi:hypothetical protein